MSARKTTRRAFLGTSARSLGVLPFVLDPMGKTLLGQTAPGGRALRFISIFTPQVPFTYKERNRFPDDIWFNLFWNVVTDPLVRATTRFFPQFSPNIAPRTLHDLGYVSALTGCQFPNIHDYDHARMGGRVNPASVVDYPVDSLDHRIARVVNQGYVPAFDITNQIALMASELAGNLTSDGYFYATHPERFFLDFVSFDAQGRTRIPWNNPTPVLNLLTGATPTGEPPPPPPLPSAASVAVDRILERMHGHEVARYLSTRSIEQTEQSFQRLMNFRARLDDLRSRREAAGQGVEPPPSTTQCLPPSFPAPGRMPVDRMLTAITTAQSEAAFDFHFEALFHCLRCDLTRVSNFMFTNWEDACVGVHFPGASRGLNVHNEASHYEGSFDRPSMSPRVNIGHAYRYWYGKIGAFLSRMAAQADPVAGDGSSMLDNTVVYIASMHGSHVDWGTHQLNNLPVMVVGGGRSLGSGQTLLPSIPSTDVLAHVFDGSNKYPALRGATVQLTRPRREVRNHNYDGGDLVTNLQLALLRLFDPAATFHGADALARSRTSIDITSPAAYHASH